MTRFLNFSTEAIPELAAAGWQIAYSDDYPYRIAEGEVGWWADIESSGIDWFGFELGIEFEGERINLAPHLANMIANLYMIIKTEVMDDGTSANRRSWAWADPDNAFNVDKLVNNSQYPKGGPPGCTWDIVNCGPNEETFSFHPGGANVAMADGSVHFIEANVTASVFAALMSKDGGEVVSIKN